MASGIFVAFSSCNRIKIPVVQFGFGLWLSIYFPHKEVLAVKKFMELSPCSGENGAVLSNVMLF